MKLSAVLALLPLAMAAPSAPIDKRAPILEARAGTQAVPGKYIVKFRETASDDDLDKAVKKLGNSKADHVYKHAFRGFAGRIDDKTLDDIRSLPEVSLPLSSAVEY